jgi:hypothetical protein
MPSAAPVASRIPGLCPPATDADQTHATPRDPVATPIHCPGLGLLQRVLAGHVALGPGPGRGRRGPGCAPGWAAATPPTRRPSRRGSRPGPRTLAAASAAPRRTAPASPADAGRGAAGPAGAGRRGTAPAPGRRSRVRWSASEEEAPKRAPLVCAGARIVAAGRGRANQEMGASRRRGMLWRCGLWQDVSPGANPFVPGRLGHFGHQTRTPAATPAGTESYGAGNFQGVSWPWWPTGHVTSGCRPSS